MRAVELGTAGERSTGKGERETTRKRDGARDREIPTEIQRDIQRESKRATERGGDRRLHDTQEHRIIGIVRL